MFRKLRSRQNKRRLLNDDFGDQINHWGNNLPDDKKKKKKKKSLHSSVKKIKHKNQNSDILTTSSSLPHLPPSVVSPPHDDDTHVSSSSPSSLSPSSSSDDDDDDDQMLQDRERKAAESREQELKLKFERERAELATERASMIKQLNAMREDIEQQKEALVQQQKEVAQEAEQHKSNARKMERDAAKDAKKKKKMSNAQMMLSSVTASGLGGPMNDVMTQTIVDEECLWETEGCKEVAVSGALLVQIWEERKEAAAKHYGHLVVTRKHDPLADPKDEIGLANPHRDQSGGGGGSSDQSGGGSGSGGGGPAARGQGGWMIPPSLRHFMSNLPKTVESQPIKSLKWLTKTIDEIYQGKLVADYYDNRDGDPLQSLHDFICEYFLMKYGMRRVAEMHLYEIVMALKKYFSRNPKVCMFARFLGCVKLKGKKLTFVDRHPDIPELDIGVLQVFLYTRRRLLLPADVLRRTETETPASIKPDSGTKKLDEGPPGSTTSAVAAAAAELSHVVHTHDQRTYVPLGHAISEMRRVCSFMAPRKLIKFMRAIEKGVMMRRGDQHDKVHLVSNDTGGQTAVRFVMRNSMLDNIHATAETSGSGSGGGDTSSRPNTEGGGGGGDGSGEELSSQWSVVCCLDTSLEILLDILEIRSKQVYEELVRAFVEGDDNGDGVLSFDEFEAIIQNKKPEFSSRRALRMFKMALESGGGNSTAIERSSFVRTCKQFGLGKLVMLDDL